MRANVKVNIDITRSTEEQMPPLVSGQEAEVEGTLSVQPQAHPVEGFEEYFLNLTVRTNTRNPWFVGKNTYNACVKRRGLHNGIVSECHRRDWSYGSSDRIPPGYM
jgi:hypothetical protein